MDKSVKQARQLLEEAEKRLAQGELEAASAHYLKLTGFTHIPEVEAIALYRLAAVANMTGEPLTAKQLYYRAFSLKPNLCSLVLSKGHVNHGYVYSGPKPEQPVGECPLCGAVGEAYWCYPVPEIGAVYGGYNPVRVWMRCDACNHLYAEEFPEPERGELLQGRGDSGRPMPTQPRLFPYYSNVLNRLLRFASGGGAELLEIGIGGSECALTAREMGFDVLGMDIAAPNIAQAKRYGLDAEQCDFTTFDVNRQFDVIIMGDVIEHVPDPVAAIKKVRALLRDDGVLWLSTPNFESAFAVSAGHADPMRREATHKNYFSGRSMMGLLGSNGLRVAEYRVSSHYNGSMELIIMKG